MQIQTPDRAALQQLVVAGLREVIEQSDRPMPATIDETTSLIGKQAVLDSLALVTLIVDLEQRVEEEFGAALTLADDRAMSQRSSPFRTVGSLVAYLEQLLGEEPGRG